MRRTELTVGGTRAIPGRGERRQPLRRWRAERYQPIRRRRRVSVGRCAFRIICPLHMEDEPWSGLEERPRPLPRSELRVVQPGTPCTHGGPARRVPLQRRQVAGAGKTFTMTELVSYTVGEHLRRLGGTAPERILALTFTVKAADEMRNRLISRLGEQALKLTVANFHSYALEMVRENAAVLGVEPDAPVLRRGRAWLMVLDELAAATSPYAAWTSPTPQAPRTRR